MTRASRAASFRTLICATAIASSIAVSASQAATTLTIFHNNDGESDLLSNGDIGGIGGYVGTLGALRAASTSDVQLTLSSGDNYLPGPEFNASLNNGVFYDAESWALIGYDALAIGNHEFDQGPDTFASVINAYKATTGGSNAPFLSANIDVSLEPQLAALAATGDIAKSTIVSRNGETYGIVGATTPNLPFISSPGAVIVDQNVVGAVQSEIDAVQLGQDGLSGTADDINKVILISHLQGVEEDQALVSQLSGVDIAIAGGGDNLLANPGNPLIPGDSAAGPYPDTSVTNADGATVPIITTKGQYEYIGVLTVEFDDEGNLTSVDADNSGPVRNFTPDGVPPDAGAVANIESPVQAYVDGLATTVVATNRVALDGVTDNVRSRETNFGNLIADALLAGAESRLADFGVDDSIPLIAIQNGGGIRDDRLYGESGQITELDTFDVLPFGNTLAVVEAVTTEQLLSTLENAVSRVVPVNGEPERQGGGTGRFAQVAGLSFSYNLFGQALELDAEGNVITPGNRILDIILDDGTILVQEGEIVTDLTVNLATLSFTAGGGDQYFFDFDQVFTLLGVGDQQVLRDYFEELGFVSSAQYGGTQGRITSVVPVPAALPLMLSGLGGLVFFRRRRS